jgi:hypothetical protein
LPIRTDAYFALQHTGRRAGKNKLHFFSKRTSARCLIQGSRSRPKPMPLTISSSATSQSSA